MKTEGFMRLFWALVLVVAGILPVHGEIAGENDAAFQAALAQWLAGDDLAALTAFSGLAKADNRAAQMFLARVGEARHTHSHVTGEMARNVRIALMRDKGGLSGTSWLKAASEDVPLAVAFLQVKSADGLEDGIAALLELGEVTAAMARFQAVFKQYNHFRLHALLDIVPLPDHADYWRSVVFRKRAVNIAHGLFAEADVVFGEIMRRSEGMRTLDDLYLWYGVIYDPRYTLVVQRIRKTPASLVEAPELTPIRRFCRANCQQDVASCMGTVLLTGRVGKPVWLELASPVETLLSTMEYHDSPRILDDLARLLRESRSEFGGAGQCANRAVLGD